MFCNDVSLPDSVESKASEPLSVETKVDEENVAKPTSNDELMENSDQVSIKSHTPIDEHTEV